ncbi:unnamed protein product [Heligmosomoides polygyrus]|uniref:Transposase n=1 Tax=Heligmosomoides polygyrus TaxID=6339 RepID=A0A183FYK2_HELPZ|nr:unnamed protein product [Heligmosomoides polygyrus]
MHPELPLLGVAHGQKVGVFIGATNHGLRAYPRTRIRHRTGNQRRAGPRSVRVDIEELKEVFARNSDAVIHPDPLHRPS